MRVLSTSLSVLMFVLCLNSKPAKAQNLAPGTDIVGYGYDVFGEYANQKSKKRYCLFTYANYTKSIVGSKQFDIPKNVIVEDVSAHFNKSISGKSKRDYSKSLSAEAGLKYEGFLFEGTINASYSKYLSGKEQTFYFTFMDANSKRRISLDIIGDDISLLKTMLEPRFSTNIDNMDPKLLFETYGTHYIASAYIGGRTDFISKSIISDKASAADISSAVEAKYVSFSGNAKTDSNFDIKLIDAQTQTKLIVVGGNSEYANNISDPISYKKWASGIAEMPVLCDFDKNSLRPIWEFASTPARRKLLEEEFNKLLAAHPFPTEMAISNKMQNKTFFVKSKSDNLYWDLAGYNLNAQTMPGKIGLLEKDNFEKGLQGADRFIKVIAQNTESEFVFFQPQHSDFVAAISGGVTTPGAELLLWSKEANNKGQLFRMLPVSGETNTYYLEDGYGLYLTSRGKSPITQENKTEADNQKWIFEPANVETEMASIPPAAYAFQNVKGKLFVDVPGIAPNAQHLGGKLQLSAMDFRTDRYNQLEAASAEGYYGIHPLHGTELWDVEGGSSNVGAKLQIYTPNNSIAQQYKFVYAGKPLTYYIVNRCGKVVEADDTHISESTCSLQLNNLTYGENQQWKLSMYNMWQTVPSDQNFYIKCAYADKYWDLPGNEVESNANGKTIDLWDLGGGTDRLFKIIDIGVWANIQVQNSGRFVAVAYNSTKNGEIVFTLDKSNGADQKFLLQFTSPFTFIIRTSNLKVIDCEGGPANYNKNGTRITQWDADFGENQQFQLIYADGPKKGQICMFSPVF